MNETQNSRGKWYWAVGLGLLAVGIALVILLGRKSTTIQSPSAPATIRSGTSEQQIVSLSNASMVRSGISVVPVEMREFSMDIPTVGVIEIPEPSQRTIAARARGRIERMFVASTGTYVHKGEPLFEFYSPDILSAEKDYLVAIGAGEMDQGHTPGMEHHADAGLMNSGKKRLELYGLTPDQIHQLGDNAKVASTITVNSPMDGLVLQKLSQEGAYVDEGTSIFQLVDLSSVWAEINVPEQAIRFVRIGQSIPIQEAAYPDEHFTGKIIFISPVEDQTSRTIRVRLSLPNPARKLRPQMTFTAAIHSGLGRSLAVPQNAVVRTGKGDYVWVIDSGTIFTRHEVTVGARSPDNYYQIVNGLTQQDKVASNGSFLVDAEHELTKSNPMAGMNMGETGSKNSGEGTGVLRKINIAEQTLTLDHGNVPGVMGAMTMAYKVADPTFLQSVTPNESVRFTLARSSDGEFVITTIQKQ